MTHSALASEMVIGGHCRGPESSRKLTRRAIGAALGDRVVLAYFATHRGSVWDSLPSAFMACSPLPISLDVPVSPVQMHLLNLLRPHRKL